MLLALLAGLLLIAVCSREKQAAIAHRSSLQKPLMGGWTLTYTPAAADHAPLSRSPSNTNAENLLGTAQNN